MAYYRKQEQELAEAASLLKTNQAGVLDKITALQAELESIPE